MCEQLTFFHHLAWIDIGFQESGTVCAYTDEISGMNDFRMISSFCASFYQLASGHKVQHGFFCLQGTFLIHTGRIGRIQGKRLCSPDLPVIVERRSIKRTRLVHHDIRHTKLTGPFRILIPGFHHADMRNKRSGHIEGCELNTVLPSLYRLKDTRCDPLRGFTQSIAGEHPVNVRVVRTPESFFGVYGIWIRTGNHKNLFTRNQSIFFLQTLQPGDKA